MFIWTKDQLLAAIDAAILAMDPTEMHVRLYKTAVSIGIDSVIGDFTEADYTGYASVAITDAHPATWLGQGAAAEYLIPAAAFTPTGTAVTNIIYGYYVTLGTGPGVLIGAEAFSSTKSMGSPADQIIINPVLGIADGQLPGVIF